MRREWEKAALKNYSMWPFPSPKRTGASLPLEARVALGSALQTWWGRHLFNGLAMTRARSAHTSTSQLLHLQSCNLLFLAESPKAAVAGPKLPAEVVAGRLRRAEEVEGSLKRQMLPRELLPERHHPAGPASQHNTAGSTEHRQRIHRKLRTGPHLPAEHSTGRTGLRSR